LKGAREKLRSLGMSQWRKRRRVGEKRKKGGGVGDLFCKLESELGGELKRGRQDVNSRGLGEQCRRSRREKMKKKRLEYGSKCLYIDFVLGKNSLRRRWESKKRGHGYEIVSLNLKKKGGKIFERGETERRPLGKLWQARRNRKKDKRTSDFHHVMLCSREEVKYRKRVQKEERSL